MVELNKPGRATLSWWQMILGIDLFLVVVTVLTRYSVQFPGRGRLGNHFNLAVEMNGGVWWSGACLLALSLMAYELYCRNEEKTKAAWLVLSVVLAGLSLDEIGSIHERISAGVDRGWLDLLPYGVVLVSLVAYAVVALFRSEKTKRSSLYIAAAFFVFGGVALQEHLENIVTWPAWSEGIRTGVEEGSELLGAFLLFWAIIPHRSGNRGNSLRAAIPDPFSMKHLPLVVLIGFVFHSLSSILAPSLIDITEKGNPLAWYPIAVFFLLFSAAFWKRLDTKEKSGNWAALALFFLFCSAGFCYTPAKLFRDLGGMVPVNLLPSFFLFIVVIGVLALSTGIRGFWSNNRNYLPVLLLLPALCLSGSPEVPFLVSGLLAYLFFTLYWRSSLSTSQSAIELGTGRVAS